MFIYIMTSADSFIPRLIGNGIAIGAVMATGLPQKLSQQNVIMGSVATGVSFSLADDIYNTVTGAQEPLLIKNMRYRDFVEKSAYMGLVSYGATTLSLDSAVASQIQNVSPFSQEITAYGILGGMIVTADMLRDYLSSQPNALSQGIAHPLRLFGY